MSKKQTPKGKATGEASRSEKKSPLRDLDAVGEKVKGGTMITQTLQHEETHAVVRSPVADLLDKIRTHGIK